MFVCRYSLELNCGESLCPTEIIMLMPDLTALKHCSFAHAGTRLLLQPPRRLLGKLPARLAAVSCVLMKHEFVRFSEEKVC